MDAPVGGGADAALRQRAGGFFRLVREYAQLRTRPRTDVAQEVAHLWLGGLPVAPDCSVPLVEAALAGGGAVEATPTAPAPHEREDGGPPDEADDPRVTPESRGADEGDDDALDDGPDDASAPGPAAVEHWIAIAKRPEPRPPRPPEELAPWIEGEWPWDAASVPGLRREAEEPEPDGSRRRVHLEDRPGVEESYARWMARVWDAHQREHAAWRTHDAAYTRLFAIHQALRRREEDLELVIAVGLLEWARSGEERLRRHLVTVPVAIHFDAARGLIEVGPAPDGAPAAAELDMLAPADRPSGFEDAVNAAADRLDDPPRGAAHLHELLAAAANGIAGGRAEYDPSIDPAPLAGDRPRVALAPALVLRRRSRGLLAERLGRIVEQVEGDEPLTPLVRLLVGDDAAAAGPGIPADVEASDTAILPLPSNREQLEVVERLRRRHGVLVQGPPGTGKSHGIANLLCHLLATGQRVLVTAQSPRALAVLRRKLPEGVRPLCLSLLGQDRGALDDLAASVAAIVDRGSGELERDRARAEAAERAITEATATLAELDAERERIRAAETTPVALEGTDLRGTPQRIAEEVAGRSERDGWLRDAVDPDDARPEALDRAAELLEVARTLAPEDEQALRAGALPPEADVPPSTELRDAFEAEARAAARVDVVDATSDGGPDPEDLDPTALDPLRDALARVDRGAAEARSREAAWVAGAVDDVLAGRGEAWVERHEVARTYADEAAGAIGPVEERVLDLPADVDRARLKADAEDLRRALADGRSLGLLSRLLDRTVRRTRYVAERVRVDGRPCDDVASLDALLESLTVQVLLERLWTYVSDLAPRKDGPLRLQMAALRACLEDLEAVVAVDHALRAAHDAVRAAAPDAPATDLGREATRTGWRATVERAAARRERAACAERLDDLAARLTEHEQSGAHPLVRRLRRAVEERALEDWIDAATELERLRDASGRLAERDRLEADIAASLPRLAESIVSTAHEPAWDARLAGLDAAWSHARARAWLARFAAAHDASGLDRREAAALGAREEALGELASARAWQHCLERMSGEERRTLNAWALANRNLGKGTGRYAERRRRKAQELLTACRDAVPAWVMPLYRVYEQVEPRPGLFDVVVVDEASQCSLDALALLHLARTLVVVGDDEQISPTVIIEREQLFDLARRHLPGDRIAAIFEPDTSLFDLARVWFEEPVRLREHFRCMPEIIGFSNQLAYDGTLVPLTQYPPDRLAPVCTVHVPDGVRHDEGGDVTNPPEAAAMVERIVACHEDPRYEGLTFGVVSLLGDAQAMLVERELTRVLGPEAMEARRLVCGDAYSFQGDERDVMFLGLVAAERTADGESARVVALTRRDAKQRFNVAASRARTQQWLFHSVELDALGNPDDLRRRLLEYCLAPPPPPEARVTFDAAHVERLAGTADRTRELPPRPFRDWLVVDAWRRLRALGYRCVPSYEVAGDPLDLVVMDGARMLAVACEGDARLDPSEARRRQERERQLRRAGWTFARLRGTAFHLDPEAAMAPVLETLERMGLQPEAPAAAAD